MMRWTRSDGDGKFQDIKANARPQIHNSQELPRHHRQTGREIVRSFLLAN
jgi:hypothetical protein